MNVSAILKNKYNSHEVAVATNNDFKNISIPPRASGFGSSVNGAELLLASLATCYCNDIYREAAKRNIEILGVEVEVTAEFGSEGEPGKNFQYKPVIRSNASKEQVDDLIRFTDEIAEIHKTLRIGLPVTLIR